MVTSTRRGPVDSTPRSTPVRRSKRVLENEDTPTQQDTPSIPKKRRTTTVTTTVTVAKKSSPKDADTPIASAETEDSTPAQAEEDTMPAPRSPVSQKKLPTRQKGRGTSPQVVIPVSSPTKEISLESEIQESIIHTPSPPRPFAPGFVMDSIARHQHVSPTPAKPKQKAAKVSKLSKQMELVEEDTSDTVEADAEDKTEKTKSPEKAKEKQSEPIKNTKIRFGSEEPMAIDTPAELPAPIPAPAPQEDDYESDSDEAPEEVSASTAQIKSKAAEADATRAFEAQQAKLEQKRKERADRMAEEQRQKREREEKKRAKEEKKAKKLAKREAAEQEPVTAPFQFDLNNLPALLPASLLEKVGDTRPPTPPRSLLDPTATKKQKQEEKLARHIKFLEHGGEKKIKDVKKGKLNVHVLDKEKRGLAPKANKDSRSVREKWLKGRQGDKMKKSKGGRMVLEKHRVERRSQGGFLRGDD